MKEYNCPNALYVHIYKASLIGQFFYGQDTHAPGQQYQGIIYVYLE